MNCEEAILRFMQHQKSVRRLSIHTLKAYYRDLSILKKRLNHHALASISSFDCRALMVEEKKGSAATWTRRLCAWRTFFNYWIDQGECVENPLLGLRAPKKSSPLPKALTPDEMASLMVLPQKSKKLAIRDQAILEILYSSGLRVSELAALNVDDINLSSETVCVLHGKGGRGRFSPLGSEAIKAIKQWFLVREQWLGQTIEKAVFITQRQKRMTTRALQLRLQYYGQQGGFVMSVSPHVLRHSCASHFLQSSGDLRATQELLGHQSITTTQIYTRLDFQHLSLAYDKAHPRVKK